MSHEDDEDDWGRDGVDAARVRAETLDELRIVAAKLFAAQPQYRSVLLSFGQFWCDEADDAVHAHLTVSERDLPLWPHRCAESAFADGEVDSIPGEGCTSCAEDLPDWFDVDENGTAVPAFEAYCHESGSQEEDDAHNFRPYAVARKRGDAIEIEVIGELLRPDDLVVAHADAGDDVADPMWSDPRARALYELVCAAPDDDQPRRVLADYLQERGDPRGELIALALAGEDTDELVATHGRRWLHPLADVLPATTWRFERGFLARADVYAPTAAAAARVRGAPTWGTVRALRIHGRSHDVLDPAMVSLREVGPVDAAGIATLARAPRPWAIETLEIHAVHPADVAALAAATTLPRLSHLTIRGKNAPALVAALPRATWWKQLARLTVFDDTGSSPKSWRDRHRELAPLPTLAIAYLDDTGDPAGWEVALRADGGVELAMNHWGPNATFENLARLVRTLPAAKGYRLVPSRYWAPTDADLARVAPYGLGN